MNLSLFRKVLFNSLKYFGYFLGIFFLSRLIFWLTYGENISLPKYLPDLISAFLMRLRFDVSATSYAFIPLALGWLGALFIPIRYNAKFQKIYFRLCKFYLPLALFVFLSLCVIDFFYYQFFQTHINILFFGIFKDDTQAVLHSAWADYPIFKILLIFIATFFGFFFIHKRNKIQENLISISKKWAVLLLIFPLYFLGLRGSLGLFPLNREYTNVSPNEFINSLSYNAVYALKFAFSELKHNNLYPHVNNELNANGFDSEKDLYRAYQEGSNYFDSDGYAHTPENDFLAKNPPNVVFVLMESMSNHYFELHSEKLNLLGDLYNLLPELYYFKNGLSSYNGTISSLENLLINTNRGVVAQSPYFETPFRSSVAVPFKEQGYQTAFITGAHTSWRNIDQLIKNQGFDVIKGNSHITQKHPNAESFAWGTHDGYLFDYIKDFLLTSEKPKFVFSLTVSNHTPYEVPKHYKSYPIDIKGLENKIRVNEKSVEDNFYAHQYSASQLARFIKEIKNSSLGENTIIVATGDHNIRQTFEYNSENQFLKYSVPILFYIPEKYKPAFFNAETMASHKDIFPTIFHLSLPNQKYIYSGDNLFSPSPTFRFAVNNSNFIADDLGAVIVENSPTYYLWSDKGKRKFTPADISEPHAQFLLKKLKAFNTFQSIQIYKDIEKYKREK
ncbi:MAG: sulfatase-like hydrolase/transferase [Flavobacteriaceae bacterium]|nr:sulfatase-like hydrolase/transferase [Flavobacteriaceae bacterium]